MDAWTYLGVKETLWELKSSEIGLSEKDALERLKEEGLNELKEKRKRPLFLLFLEQFKSFLVILLIFAMIFSYLIRHFVDAAVISAIIVLNALLGFFQEFKAEKAMEALKKMSPPEAVVLRDGKESVIPASELVSGDVIFLKAGDDVPADCRVIESMSLQVDESSITGESVPVQKTSEAMKKKASSSEMKNILFMSTDVVYGTGKAVVIRTGMNTRIGKIAELIQEDFKTTPLQAKLQHFGSQICIFVVLISALIALIGIARGNPLVEMLIMGISIAVAAVPEGLPAVVTVTLALGLQKLAGKNAVIRHLSAVETLGSTTVICSDKTGTITKNEMMVTELLAGMKEFKVTGEGYGFKGFFYEKEREINPLKENSLEKLILCGLLCSNAVIEKGKLIGDHTEGALVALAEKAGIGSENARHENARVGELPFDSERKMMTTFHRKGIGNSFEAYSKGAPEMIIRKCTHILSEGNERKITEKDIEKILKKEKEMASRALRVLAFASKKADAKKAYSLKDEKGMVFLGLAGMIDPPREGVKESIAKCRKAGIRVMMLTGDFEITAKAIAIETGLIKAGERIVSGSEIEKMNTEELEKTVKNANVFARITPEHKMKIVKILQEQGQVVAVTGDGVNDAPALKKADIGIAMGITGTDVSKESSDMILADDNFSTIVLAVEEGRAIYENIKKFIKYLLSCNAGEVMTMLFAGIVGLAFMPLVPVQILWMNLVTDGLPAMALGVNPHEKDSMKEMPRKKSDKVIGKKSFYYIMIIGLMMSLITLAVFISEISNPETARTMAFTTLMMLQMAVVLSVKNERSVFKGGSLFDNKLLLFSVGTSVFLQAAVVYVPALQKLFHTTALPFEKVALILGICMAVFIAIEIIKAGKKG